MDHLTRAKTVFDIEIEALKKVRSHLGEDFAKATDAIVQTLNDKGKIIVAGIGKSGNIGIKMAATFAMLAMRSSVAPVTASTWGRRAL